ncbi:c-type cytochrome [Rhizobium leguminosarum]|uniref:c-type cytochrome n=1 Tax=Rhizobium leguminosarum TaxID=384 RepID=UPI00035EE920|nr:c-type cytochrome [Rhizobium leguminosarum]
MSGEGFPVKIVVPLLVTMLGLAAGVLTYQVRDRNRRTEVASLLARGDPARAPEIFRRYGCTGCHTIPGIAGANGKVGGPLVDIRQRVYLAGVANNDAEALVHWIVAPSAFDAKTAMPDTGISEAEARDLAAYLYGQ